MRREGGEESKNRSSKNYPITNAKFYDLSDTVEELTSSLDEALRLTLLRYIDHSHIELVARVML